MFRFISCSVLLFSFFSQAFGQEFRCLINDRPRYYVEIPPNGTSNWPQNLVAYKIVQIETIGLDTIYHLQHGAETSNGANCDGNGTNEYHSVIYGRGWLGKKMLITPDGWNLFFNVYGDTVWVNTQANLGESWDLVLTPTLHIMASVTGISEEVVDGIQQQVKTIEFEKLSGEYDGFLDFEQGVWRLSQYSGLIEFIPPYIKDENYGLNFLYTVSFGKQASFELTDHRQLTIGEVFDHQENDVVQWNASILGQVYARQEYFTRTVLSRTDHLPDSITYVFEYDVKRFFDMDGDQVTDSLQFIEIDTVTFTNLSAPYPFGLLPRQILHNTALVDTLIPIRQEGQLSYGPFAPNTHGQISEGYGYVVNEESIVTECDLELRRISTGYSMLLQGSSDSCALLQSMVGFFIVPIFHVVPKVGVYKTYDAANLSTGGSITYISTAEYQCGTLQYVGLEKVGEVRLQIAPNPADAFIRFTSPHRGAYSILNIMGQPSGSGTVEKNTNMIDVSSLPCGLFLLILRTEKGLFSERFMKR